MFEKLKEKKSNAFWRNAWLEIARHALLAYQQFEDERFFEYYKYFYDLAKSLPDE